MKNISVARVASVAALGLAIFGLAMIMFGPFSSGYQIHAIFQSAGQIVKGNTVRIGGNPAGKVTGIKLTDNNQVEVTVEIDSGYAPLHEGTTATERRNSLPSIANNYIAINPGPNNRPQIASGAVLSEDKTTSVVDLDAAVDLFNPKTRSNLRNLIKQFQVLYDGKGEAANQTYKYLGPALGSATQVTDQLLADEDAFKRFIVDSSSLVTAVAQRKVQLAGLVRNGNTSLGAIASESTSLSSALATLPDTLQEANTAFVKLRTTMDDLGPLVDELEPVSKDLAPFLAQLKPVLERAQPVIHDLNLIISNKGSNNDATDLLENGPQLGKKGKQASDASIKAMQKSLPFFSFLRPYSVDITAWVTKLGQVASMYDANGHIMRVQPDFLNFELSGSTLNQLTAAQRDTFGLQTGKVKRCPGGATQPGADGSNPYLDNSSFDCDPSTVPPGP